MTTINFPSAAGGAEVQIDFDSFSPEIKRQLMLHGLQQKVADSVANAKAKGWSPIECRSKCNDVIATLQRGEWSTRAVGPRVSDEAGFIRREAIRAIQAAAKAANREISVDDLAKAAEALMASEAPAHAKMRAAWAEAYAAEMAKRDAKKGAADILGLLSL